MADSSPSPALRPTNRVWLLVVVLLAAATSVQTWLSLAASRSPTGPHLPWLILAAGFAAGEACVVHIHWGRETHSFGFGEIPLVVGLILAAPGELVTARLVGAGVALVVFRQQRGLKLVFNLAQWWLGTGLAVLVWQLARDTNHPYSSRNWLAAVGAALVTEVVATVAINAAIRLRGSPLDTRLAWTTCWTGLLTSGANACFGLVTVDVLLVDWRGGWALATVAVFLGFAQRAHVVLQRRHGSLERLNEFSAGLSHLFDVQAVIEEVLRGAAELLNARGAELWLDARFAGRTLVYQRDGSGLHRLEGASMVPLPGASRLQRTWRRTYAQVGELTVHLTDASEVIGAITVRGRLGDVGAFGYDDLRLLRGLVGHANAALVNGRLADRLREQVQENEFQALHDALTGLPNRVMFDRGLKEALADGEQVTVMLMDLDRFKEVNDTLGHATGDKLLREVGERIRQAAPTAQLIARLGGDEFALLFRGSSSEVVSRCASDVRDALLHPIAMQGVTLSVDASMGIALTPDHGHDTSSLLRHADVAMYRAKQNRSGLELYSPEEDDHTSTRLSLVGELREAIRADELELWFQPKADLTTGAITSVESLVRWRHPERGLVPPDDFIPIAEQTGLINPLTEWVLEEALGQCRRWRQAGLGLSVAVNVSPRSLRRDSFPDEVRRCLARHQVPPSLLTLEITESAILEDPRHAGATLRDLRALGVRISVDDFGTGYSSLTNLKDLPVDEVKIDKSFITNLLQDAQDEAIAGAIVHLVHQLGMVVVAEGVETQEIWQRLRDMSCDTAQGYLISRPMEATALPPFLASRAAYAIPRQTRLQPVGTG